MGDYTGPVSYPQNVLENAPLTPPPVPPHSILSLKEECDSDEDTFPVTSIQRHPLKKQLPNIPSLNGPPNMSIPGTRASWYSYPLPDVDGNLQPRQRSPLYSLIIELSHHLQRIDTTLDELTTKSLEAESVSQLELARDEALREDIDSSSDRVYYAKLVMDAERSTDAELQMFAVRHRSETFQLLSSLVSVPRSADDDPQALYLMGVAYSTGALGLEIDHALAFRLYADSANLHHSNGAYRTAICLQMGVGTDQDLTEAVYYFSEAAANEHVGAMHRLGIIFLRGLYGVERDASLGLCWLIQAALSSTVEHPHSLFDLAQIYESPKPEQKGLIAQDMHKAFLLYFKAACFNVPEAQFRVALCFSHGELGCPIDTQRSLLWYTRAANNQYTDAAWELAKIYYNGYYGINTKNVPLAIEWAKKAAARKHLEARQFLQTIRLSSPSSNSSNSFAMHNETTTFCSPGNSRHHRLKSNNCIVS